MNIVESLRSIEDKLFMESGEVHNLVGEYYNKNVDKSSLTEMIEKGDISGIISLIESTNYSDNDFTTLTEKWHEGDDDIREWLYDHEQATDDILNHFDVEDLYSIDIEDILSWVSDHEELSDDFERHFGFSVDEWFSTNYSDDDFATAFGYDYDKDWELLDSKSVQDFDGFWTNYTLWKDNNSDRFVCIFGDDELYNPDNAEPDAEFETEREAREWFDNYSGFEDDLEWHDTADQEQLDEPDYTPELTTDDMNAGSWYESLGEDKSFATMDDDEVGSWLQSNFNQPDDEYTEDFSKLSESVYTENGYSNRKEYLNSLADDFGVDVQTVYDLASVLGPDEDFDALVTELEDLAYSTDTSWADEDEEDSKTFDVELKSYYDENRTDVEDSVVLNYKDYDGVIKIQNWILDKASKGFFVTSKDVDDKLIPIEVYRPMKDNENIRDYNKLFIGYDTKVEESLKEYIDSTILSDQTLSIVEEGDHLTSGNEDWRILELEVKGNRYLPKRDRVWVTVMDKNGNKQASSIGKFFGYKIVEETGELGEELVVEKVAPSDYAPKKSGTAYKVFKVKNGKLYPPMVANAGGEDTPVGKWLEAEEGEFAGLSKTGRKQVKAVGGGNLSYRPGWHLGEVPRAPQFDRTNKETGEKEFPKDFVWAKCSYTMDVDYQPESDEQGYIRTKVDDEGNVTEYRSDKYQHSLAGLHKLPKDGYYKYRTNPRPDTVPWIITGAIKVDELLDDFQVNEILKKNGIEPIHRQGGDKTLKELGL